MERKTKAALAVLGAFTTAMVSYGQLKGEVKRHSTEISGLLRMTHKIDKKQDLLGYRLGLQEKFEAIDKQYDDMPEEKLAE